MDESLFALGAACVDADFRDSLFEDVNGVKGEFNLSLNGVQIDGLYALTQHERADELKGMLTEVQALIWSMACPMPPCPWPPYFMAHSTPLSFEVPEDQPQP